MTALEDLRVGTFGDDLAPLLYTTMRAVARARNFPAPDGHGAWTPDAVFEASHDFLVSTNAKRRLTELAVLAHDDDELARLLQTACLNFLRERSRATATGKLIRRLKDILRADTAFAEVPPGRPGAGNVVLAAATTAEPSAARHDDLVRAAWTVEDVAIVRWSPTTRRQPPLSDRDSLARVAAAVLDRAGGSLPWADLATAVGARFGLNPSGVPAVTAVDDVDGLADETDPAGDVESTREMFVGVAADAVLAQLTAFERLVLAHLDEPVRAVASAVGVAPSTAATAVGRVKRALRVLLADESAADEIAVEAVRRARQAHANGPDG